MFNFYFKKLNKCLLILFLAGIMVICGPYSILTLILAFVHDIDIDPLAATAPLICAKTIYLWPALINFLLNKNISRHLHFLCRNKTVVTLNFTRRADIGIGTSRF